MTAPAFRPARDRDDLRLSKSSLLRSNLLVDVSKKLQPPTPLQKAGDYHGFRILP